MAKLKMEIKSQIPNPKSQTYKFGLLVIWLLVIVCNLVLGNWNLTYVYGQDKIVAVVNNEVITQKDLNEFLTFMRMQLSEEFKGKQLEDKIQSMKLDLLDRLIEDRLVLQEAKKEKIAIDEERVKAKLVEARKRYGSDTEFQAALSRQGFTQADIETRIREQLLMYAIIEIKIKSKIVINPTEVTEFYQKNSEKFKIPEEREVTSIIIDNENLVNEVFNNLKQGADPKDIATRYAVRIDKMRVWQDEDLKKEIKDTVFKLNIGEISRPMKVEESFYIFRLDNILPNRQQKLSEVKESIYSFLLGIKMQEKLSKWLDELKAQSYIKISSN